MGIITFDDDGTYITMKAEDTSLLKYKKSDGQIELNAGIDTDQDI